MKWAVAALAGWCGCGDNSAVSPYASCDSWHQWGNDPSHTGASCSTGQPLDQMLADIQIDPFAAQEEKDAGGDLVIHYQAPLVDGDDVFVMTKAGTYTPCPVVDKMPNCSDPNAQYRLNTQVWTEARYSWQGGQLTKVWSFESDWKPEPVVGFEPMFQPAIVGDAIAIPGASGSVWIVDRESGAVRDHVLPLGVAPASDTYVSGAITEFAGHLYYNVLQLDHEYPFQAFERALLVAVAPDGTSVVADYQDLVPGAPGPDAGCYGYLPTSLQIIPSIPQQPITTMIPAEFPCGRQLPGVNSAPAFGYDGTMYVVTHAQYNEYYSYLISLEPVELQVNWAASLRDRLDDGCGVLFDCVQGAPFGVDPATGLAPAVAVDDGSSSMPVVLHDGTVIYGGFTYYNGDRGHLLAFDHAGGFRGSYDFGWDTTPAVIHENGRDRIVMKENNYFDGMTLEPGPYQLTSLDESLSPIWKYASTETRSCVRNPDGTISCVDNHPHGFEWCINAPAVDRDGTVFANSEDGHLYAVAANGELRDRYFLGKAEGAAYTPVAIDHVGRIYALNDGHVYAVGAQ